MTIGDRNKVFAPNQMAQNDDTQSPDQPSGSETKLGLAVDEIPPQVRQPRPAFTA